METTEIRYAKSGDVHVGYQVTGDGPIDLLACNSGSNVWIDRDDEPHWNRFDQRLASFSRLIRFDPRGIGVSDPFTGGSLSTVEQWVEDAVAVLDAVGSSKAAVFGVGSGGLVAMMLSATSSERISAQILMNSSARLARDVDYPIGIPQGLIDRFVDTVSDPESGGDHIGDLTAFAPSLAGNAEFRSWWKRAGERNASPAVARSLDIVSTQTDLRAVLPIITTPTLVLHRVDNTLYRVSHGRYLADHIAGATLVELPGADHLSFAGETDEVIAGIEEFLTGTRSPAPSDRFLATILFTDIVASTEHAADTGDHRWRELLDDHDRMTERQVLRFGGRRIKSTGDGVLATFDGPARAIHCGLAVADGARQLGLEVRAGVHTGEVERRDGDVAGIGVHIAARVESCARPGEVWVSRTVTDLVAGSGITFADRGEHELKGVPGSWQLFVVET